MKRILLFSAAVLTAAGLSAHRESFFKWDFPKEADMGNPAWSFNGVGDYEEGDANFIVLYDGSTNRDGVPYISFTHDFTSHGRTDWFSPEFVSLRFIAGSDISTDSHVTPNVEVKGENGSVVYHFDKAKSTLEESQTLVSTSVDGDIFNLGKVQSMTVYFDNVAEDEMMSFEQVCVYSHWYFPTLDSRKKTLVRQRAQGNGVEEVWETGTTYIQAEDYDENSINGRVAHSPVVAGGGNAYRSWDSEDGMLYVAAADGGMDHFYNWSLEGKEYGNQENYGIKNCIPVGNWYEYHGPYSDETNRITLEQAQDNFGTWFEYTFDALENCQMDLSLGMGMHAIPWTAAELGITDKETWLAPKEEFGFDVTELPTMNYFTKYGCGVRVYVDGVLQRSAWDSAPRCVAAPEGESANDVNVAIILDPTKWTNYQVDENSSKVNDSFVYVFPWPYGDLVNPGEPSYFPYETWHCYYKEDLIRTMVAQGDLTENAASSLIHGDYVNIPVTKGRHTIKIQTLGGLTFFDDFKLYAHDGDNTAVDEVFDESNAFNPDLPSQYFDLQGRRVDNPGRGVYIERQGSKARKILEK